MNVASRRMGFVLCVGTALRKQEVEPGTRPVCDRPGLRGAGGPAPSMNTAQMRSVRSRRVRSAYQPAGMPDSAQKMPNTPSRMPMYCESGHATPHVATALL